MESVGDRRDAVRYVEASLLKDFESALNVVWVGHWIVQGQVINHADHDIDNRALFQQTHHWQAAPWFRFNFVKVRDKEFLVDIE